LVYSHYFQNSKYFQYYFWLNFFLILKYKMAQSVRQYFNQYLNNYVETHPNIHGELEGLIHERRTMAPVAYAAGIKDVLDRILLAFTLHALRYRRQADEDDEAFSHRRELIQELADQFKRQFRRDYYVDAPERPPTPPLDRDLPDDARRRRHNTYNEVINSRRMVGRDTTRIPFDKLKHGGRKKWI
jgi:hypothetical protein